MDLTFAGLLRHARDTVTDPRGTLRRVLALPVSPREGWLALLLMAVASALVTHLSLAAAPPEAQAYFMQVMSSPLRTAAMQFAVMAGGAWLIARMGALRGGKGTLPQAVLAVAWLQFVLFLFQLLQLAAEVVLPPLAGLMGLAGMVLFFWLLTNFVAEVHGFASLALTLVGIVLGLMIAGVVMAVMLALLFGAPEAV